MNGFKILPHLVLGVALSVAYGAEPSNASSSTLHCPLLSSQSLVAPELMAQLRNRRLFSTLGALTLIEQQRDQMGDLYETLARHLEIDLKAILDFTDPTPPRLADFFFKRLQIFTPPPGVITPPLGPGSGVAWAWDLEVKEWRLKQARTTIYGIDPRNLITLRQAVATFAFYDFFLQ